jgi:hypothetical protein
MMGDTRRPGDHGRCGVVHGGVGEECAVVGGVEPSYAVKTDRRPGVVVDTPARVGTARRAATAICGP